MNIATVERFNELCGFTLDPQAEYTAEQLLWMDQLMYAALVRRNKTLPLPERFAASAELEQIKNRHGGLAP